MFHCSKRFNQPNVLLALPFVLAACGGGGGGDAPQNDAADPGPANDGNNPTLFSRVVTGSDSLDNARSWNCGDSEFFFWQDGTGRNVSDGGPVDFTWATEETDQSIIGRVDDVTRRLLNVSFSADDAFSALDEFDAETINCSLGDAGDFQINIASVEELILNGDSATDPGRNGWFCNTGEFLSFWADGTGRAIVDFSSAQDFVWESQVENTLTVNGVFLAAFFNMRFDGRNQFTASEGASNEQYSCSRVPLAEIPVVEDTNGNRPPEVADNSITSRSQLFVVEFINPQFSDPDGDQLTFSISPQPPATFVFDEFNGTLLATPVEVGEFEFTITASDGQFIVDANVSIEVSDPNGLLDPPSNAAFCPCEIENLQQPLLDEFGTNSLRVARRDTEEGVFVTFEPIDTLGISLTVFVRDSITRAFPSLACSTSILGGFGSFPDLELRRFDNLSRVEAEACSVQQEALRRAL